MESRPHGRDLQTPIYPLPDGSVKGNIGVILNCALNHVRFRAAMHPTWCMAECGIWNTLACGRQVQPRIADIDLLNNIPASSFEPKPKA